MASHLGRRAPAEEEGVDRVPNPLRFESHLAIEPTLDWRSEAQNSSRNGRIYRLESVVLLQLMQHANPG